MQSVEERFSKTDDRAPDAGRVTEPPLQIRMNPFAAPIKRAPDFDARVYLGERASSLGRPDLFTLEAANLAIEASGGLPRDLRGIAQFAFFAAASEGVSQIDCRHVAGARETWVAQNGEPVIAHPRFPESRARVCAAPAPEAKVVPAPVPSTVSPSAASISPIRREVIFSTQPAAPAESVSPKRRWVRRAVEATAAFVALFALVGLISSQVTGSNLRSIKRSAALPVVSEDLTTAVIEPPATEPQQAAEKTSPPSPAAKATPVAATPVSKPVENAASADPALDQVPTEDHIKSENP
jgi:hypothetical protein